MNHLFQIYRKQGLKVTDIGADNSQTDSIYYNNFQHIMCIKSEVLIIPITPKLISSLKRFFVILAKEVS